MTYYILADKPYRNIPNLDEARRIAIQIIESGYDTNIVNRNGFIVVPIYKSGTKERHSYVSMAPIMNYGSKYIWTKGMTAYAINMNGKRRY